MSKEHRVDPQVTRGLLIDAGGFPLADAGGFPPPAHLFEATRPKPKSLIPVRGRRRASRRRRHRGGRRRGMLSATNLLALDDARFRFSVESKISKAP